MDTVVRKVLYFLFLIKHFTVELGKSNGIAMHFVDLLNIGIGN